MKKLFLPLLVSLFALLTGGCTSNIDATTAGLHTELVKLQRSGNGDIQVTWRVHNPNVVAYVLSKSSLKVSLDGVPIGTVEAEKRFGIPAMNQIEQTSVLKVASPAASEAVTRAVARGSAGYTLGATLWLLMRDEDVEKFTLTASGTAPASAE